MPRGISKTPEETKRKMSETHKRIGTGKWMKGRKNEYLKLHPTRYWLGKKRGASSIETRKKQSESMKSKNKVLITPENARIRDSLEFRLWRESVFKRDNWTCQKCKIRGSKLQAHHIYNFSSYKELRFKVDNGITFCKNCHIIFHILWGKYNNNKTELLDFLQIYE